MHAQHPSSSVTEASTNTLKAGDKVSYVTINAESRGYSLSARTGVITEIEGEIATVRAGNGRRITLPLNKLSPEGRPNALTRMLGLNVSQQGTRDTA